MLLHRRSRHLKQAPRAARLAVLALAVLAAHLGLVATHWPTRLGDGGSEAARERFEISFVNELRPTTPPPVAERPAAAAPAAAAAPVVSAAAPAGSAASAARSAILGLSASAASAASSAPSVSAAAAAGLPASAPQGVAAASAAASSPGQAVAAAAPVGAAASAGTAFVGPVFAATAASSAQAVPAAPAPPAGFEWPPSTRLSYHLTGQARGPVEGQARVEWLRQGARYQVVMEASVGPSFAPLMTRRETSEGKITPEGLSPQHYEMEMKVVLRTPRRTRIAMDGGLVRLPSGESLPRPLGVQDAVSQFVQMTWLFTVQPALLTPGRSIEMPLALPRRVEPWTYDVVGPETLYTAAGAIETVHVRPRRPARPGDFTAEMWVAPSLQNLPVRIIVRQDAEHWIDLALERWPQQAAPGR